MTSREKHRRPSVCPQKLPERSSKLSHRPALPPAPAAAGGGGGGKGVSGPKSAPRVSTDAGRQACVITRGTHRFFQSMRDIFWRHGAEATLPGRFPAFWPSRSGSFPSFCLLPPLDPPPSASNWGVCVWTAAVPALPSQPASQPASDSARKWVGLQPSNPNIDSNQEKQGGRAPLCKTSVVIAKVKNQRGGENKRERGSS